MAKEPRVATVNEDTLHVIEIMEQAGIRYIPIVDEDGHSRPFDDKRVRGPGRSLSTVSQGSDFKVADIQIAARNLLYFSLQAVFSGCDLCLQGRGSIFPSKF